MSAESNEIMIIKSKIVLITGAPASGKTTIAQAVAGQLERSIHIQVDKLREMVVSGLALPGGDGGWPEEASHQFRLARTSVLQMAQTYADGGFTVVIDDVCVPEHFAADYAALPDAPTNVRVLLRPTQETILKRLKERNGPFDQILAGHVPWIYSCMDAIPKSGWVVLDSSNWSVEETIEQVKHLAGAG
jgi:chloramphenicol 3-O-phosphotransferase